MKKLSDIEIIDSVLRGNKNDYALIVDRYKDKAFTLLKNMLKNKMEAEEALMDAFIKAFNSLSSFRKEARFSTWFYRIVFNTGASILANKKRKIELEMSSVDELHNLKSTDAETYALSENLNGYIQATIEKLPVRYAIAINLFYIDNLSLSEISEVMDISLVNAKTLLHRGRNLLRDLLIKHNYAEELL
ncbi:MAG: sigma-70 family RNA polymerase sigma factor [Chlorobi bacterium]|nr:sigma-70 family RNA polymerase sigma factor [Chlorobiota bacterium]